MQRDGQRVAVVKEGASSLDLVRAHPEYRVIELAQGQVVYDSKAAAPATGLMMNP